MSEAIAYGIDFGTSNSSIAVAYADGSTEVASVERSGTQALRSLVYLHRDGNRQTGDASVQAFLTTGTAATACGRCQLVDRSRHGTNTDCRQHRAGGSCRDSRLLAQIKKDLSSDHLDRTNSWARDFQFAELVGVVLKRLKKSADKLTGRDVRRVAIGRPVRFPGVEADPGRLQALAEERLFDAAVLAGFEHVDLVPEPQAAVTVEGVDDGLVVCTDFGGGTFDIAVLSKQAKRGRVLALGGVPIGGESFDARIFDLKLRTVFGLDRTGMGSEGKSLGIPSWLRVKLRSLAGCQELLTDSRMESILREMSVQGEGHFAEALRELLYGGQAWACFQAVERAKMDLSSRGVTRITLRRPPYLQFDEPLGREEFEEVIRDDLLAVRQCIERTLDDADVRASEVSYVTRTGGSSRIPAFTNMLDDMFGSRRVVERDAFTTVVTGLAQFAYSEWATSRRL